MESLTLSLFCAALLLCLFLNVSILYALALGLVIFFAYAVKKGYSPTETFKMCLDGIKTARNVLLTFFLIGVLTAFWRSAGTIPAIICYTEGLFRPSLFLLITFLLNCLVSVLTGTSFGTAATMGVICATMADAMQLSPALVGGAVLSGAFFGDRCSPVSTSALLVSELTQTDIFDNIRRMLKTAAIPMAITCLVYGLLGFFSPHITADLDLTQTFRAAFRLHWAALLPAIVILLLAAFRIPVKKTMLLSILTAIPVCIFLQGRTWQELLISAVVGYQTEQAEVATMLNGGGIISMLRVSAIVCISSAYSGIFQKTGLLDGVQHAMTTVSKRITVYGAMLAASVLTGSVACNQTLTIMLTKQLSDAAEPDGQVLAVNLENSAVVIAPLIPWSIAGGVPLSSIGAPTLSLLFACFLYILPLWNLFMELMKAKHTK